VPLPSLGSEPIKLCVAHVINPRFPALSQKQQAEVLAYELGHLLLHLGHPFGSESCLMSPAPLLRFRTWYDHLDPAQCQPNSSPEMTPGAATLDYRADWIAP
jgi:hypothetical protein